ncbi:MAG: alginate export family protein [Acidobacteriota bacterium]|nr:alginate export family protein [Acidobacteriota bacterium]
MSIKLGVLVVLIASGSVMAQDDVTTRNGGSGYNGAWITGPASNPLSFLNGPAYRTFAQTSPYLLPDFAPASRLNEELPHWIQFGAEERLRYEGYHNSGFKLNNNDSYLLNRLRIQMNLQFTSWFKVVSQVQDARPALQKPPYGPPNENRWDLKLAYAEFGDPEKQWISLRVGRQMINYNNTIIANSEWRNQGRSFDAVVANLHYQRYRLGIFAASAVNPLISGISHHQEGNNIYGIYGTIDKIFPNSDLEPFVLWRVAPGRRDEKAYGVRLKGLLAPDLDYTYEAIVERGNVGTRGLRAWAQTVGAGYRFTQAWARPRAFAQYDYASPTFDTMYPTAHDRFGVSDQFGWQNIVAGRAGLTVEPRRRWTVTAQYLDFWLASATDPLFNTSGGSIVRDTAGRAGKHIGEEFDVYTWLELNRHVNFGVGVAHLMPGAYLAANSKGPTYNYPYFAINFKDDGKSKRQ